LIFVKVDGEDLSRKIFRRAQNGIKCEGGKSKTKECIKITDNHILKIILDR
jgi:hypothetical protein